MVHLRMLDSLDGSQRLQMAIEMSEFVKRLKRSALKSEHPDLSETEVTKLVLRSCFKPAESLPTILR